MQITETIANNSRHLLFANGEVLKFNEQQINAIDALIAFLSISDKTTFTLSGYAGTGKTTIIKKIIDLIRLGSLHLPYITLPYQIKDLCVTAPTHKSKKVIEIATGMGSKTIQSLCGLAPNIDLDTYDPNQPTYGKKRQSTIGLYKIIILDECSMISKNIFELIKKLSTEKKIKIIFMGDAAQLPPIGESISATFIDIDQCFNLSKIERTVEGNPLLEIFNDIRTNITNQKIKVKTNNSFNENGGYFFYTDKQLFKQELLNYILSDKYDNSTNYVKICAWTNNTVQHMNNMIRKEKYNTDNMLVIGEKLLSYTTIMDDYEYIIRNSEEYIVKDVSKESAFGYEYYHTLLENESKEIIERKILDNDNEMSLIKFESELNHLQEDAKKASFRYKISCWKKYYNLKEEYLLLGDIKNKGKLSVAKTIDYGYCSTIHKLQGSTCDIVFINLRDIWTNYNYEERNKLLYVALSRARYNAYLLG